MATEPIIGNVEQHVPHTSNLDVTVQQLSIFEINEQFGKHGDAESHVLSNLDQDAPHSLLATAIIRVKNARNTFDEIRVLCDTGAQVNLLSDVAFRRLNFARKSSGITVVGVGGASVISDNNGKNHSGNVASYT